MKPEEKLQQLLRLKLQEQPPEGYFEDFLSEFQTRQRQDLMKRSLLAQIGERFTDWCAVLTQPRVLVPTAACYFAAMVLLLTWPQKPKPTGITSMQVVLAQPPEPTGGQAPAMGSQLVGLPPAPQPAQYQQVNSVGLEQGPNRPRTTSPEALKKLVGEPLPEPPPARPAADSGKLREL